MAETVLFSANENGVATITLQQPKTVNALTLDMLVPIKQKLQEWEQDQTIQVVILQGSGSKGFCSGGDMKALHKAKQDPEVLREAEQFFAIEYQTDELATQFSKPIIACLDGIVMGGGVGLSYGASHRIVTERTKWAMPEMNIGFFPDVGAAYFLNKAPGYIGRYLALTATVLRAADVLQINAADAFIPSDRLPDFLQQLETTNWHTVNVEEALQDLLDTYSDQPETDGTLATMQAIINQYFSYTTMEEIVDALTSDTGEFAVATKKTLLAKSPVSLKVTLANLIKGEGKTFAACLETDRTIAKHFIRHADFFEGVRSVLIDKDHRPQYRYKQLQDVSAEFVNSFFKG